LFLKMRRITQLRFPAAPTTKHVFSQIQYDGTRVPVDLQRSLSPPPRSYRSRLLPVLTVVLLCAPAALLAATKKASAPTRSAASRTGLSRRSASSRIATRHHYRAHHSEYQQRISKIHLEPQRIQEIQRALNQAGYLHQEPNGAWDAETHAAMEKYQQDNHFSSTGLPDARSLMKLGLGPHPLPAAADPAAAKTAADSTLTTSPSPPSVEQARP
jgi:hypothetical protein